MATTETVLQALAAYLLLPVAGLAVGWALWRWLARPAQATLPLGWVLITGLTALAWIGALLAALNLFRPWVLGLIMLALLLGALLLPGARRRRLRLALPKIDRGAICGGLLLLAAAALLARPAETFMVTDDAGVYTLGAVHLAQSGSLQYTAAGIYPLEPERSDLGVPAHSTAYWDALQDYARQFLLPENVGMPAGTRFWGPFFQPVLYRQQVEIGFLPLTKVFGALFGWVLGLRAVVWAGPAITLLSLAAFIALLRRTSGWGLAIPAGAMLAFCLPQLWFGRQLLSEPLAQALIVGALWLDAEADAADEHTGAVLRAIAALLLGLLALVRLEGALLAGVVLCALAWHSYAGAWGNRRTLWLLGGALLVGQIIAILTSPAYFYSRLIGIISQHGSAILAAGLVLLAVPLAIRFIPACAAAWRRVQAWLASARHRALIATAPLALYLALAGWQLLTRPLAASFSGWLAQYWTRPAFILGIIGLGLLPWLLPGRQRALQALASAGACFGLLFALNPYVTHVHPWAMRRTVPLLLPALATGTAFAIGALAGWLRRRWPGGAWPRLATAGCLAVTAGLTFGIAQRTVPLAAHNERQGMWAQLAQLNSLLEPHSLLLLDDGQIGRQIAQPLALIYGHAVYNVQDTAALDADSAVVERLLATAQAQGRASYWLVSDSTRRFAPQGYDFDSLGGVAFETPVLGSTTGGPPGADDLVRQSFFVDVYALQPATGGDDARLVSEIPLGAGSYPFLIAGFYSLEQDAANGPYRWTGELAEVHLPWPGDAEAPIALDVSLTVSGWRPDDMSDPTVSLWAEGQLLATQTIPADGALTTLHGQSAAITNTHLPDIEIALGSDTFVPGEHGLGADSRALGVRVFAIAAQAAPGEPE